LIEERHDRVDRPFEVAPGIGVEPDRDLLAELDLAHVRLDELEARLHPGQVVDLTHRHLRIAMSPVSSILPAMTRRWGGDDRVVGGDRELALRSLERFALCPGRQIRGLHLVEDWRVMTPAASRSFDRESSLSRLLI